MTRNHVFQVDHLSLYSLSREIDPRIKNKWHTSKKISLSFGVNGPPVVSDNESRLLLISN